VDARRSLWCWPSSIPRPGTSQYLCNFLLHEIKIFMRARKRLAVRFPAVKSSLYLTENLLGGQLPFVLWCWHVGLLSHEEEEDIYAGLTWIHVILFRATSHTSQEPWPWDCESPKGSVQRPSQHTSKIMSCGHGPSSVVWSHMWPGPQLNVISMNFYS
jgi:hypothetical protein